MPPANSLEPTVLQDAKMHSLSTAKRIRQFLRPYRRGLLILLLPLSLLLTEWAAQYPTTVEWLFSRRVYRVFTEVLGRIFGLFPFSVAELALYGLIFIGLLWLTVHISRLVRLRDITTRLPGMLATLCCVVGVGYFLFTLFCGLNYHRVTFADQSGLEVRPSSVEELAALYQELVETANNVRQQVISNHLGEMVLSQDSYHEAGALAAQAMHRLSERYPFLKGFTPRAKPVKLSRLMSVIDITGIYIPFTFEGNVNVDVPDYYIPFSMIHELAHFKGFMREDEANFIAHLGCREMDDPAFQYSGTVLALIHSGNALYRVDPDLYFSLSAQLSEEVRRDFAAGSAYWQQFEGPVAEAAGKINDSYLKANRQVEGVQSYGRMVDLLLADYRARHATDNA